MPTTIEQATERIAMAFTRWIERNASTENAKQAVEEAGKLRAELVMRQHEIRALQDDLNVRKLQVRDAEDKCLEATRVAERCVELFGEK